MIARCNGCGQPFDTKDGGRSCYHGCHRIACPECEPKMFIKTKANPKHVQPGVTHIIKCAVCGQTYPCWD